MAKASTFDGLWSRINRDPPVQNEVELAAVRLFRNIVWVQFCCLTVGMVAIMLIPPHWYVRRLTLMCLEDGGCIAALFLLRRGQRQIAQFLNIGVLVTLVTYVTITGALLGSVTMVAYLLIVLMASLTMDDRGANVVVVICAGAELAVALVEQVNGRPTSVIGIQPFGLWIAHVTFLFIVLGVQRAARRSMEGAQQQAQTARREQESVEAQLRSRDLALERQESEFRALFENAPFGVAMTDRGGKVRLCNEALAKFLGYSAEELTGMSRAAYTHPDDIAATEKLSTALRSGQIPEYRLDKRYIRKDGQVVWGRLWACLIGEAASERVYALALLEDLTASRQADKERRALEAQLLQAQKMEAVGHLAGGVAHDFNNLLTVIAGYNQMVYGELPENAPSRRFVQEIQAATDRASGLTRQLLAFSRKTVLEPRVLDVNQLVQNLENMLRRLIGEDIEFVTVLHPRLPRVKADPGLLEQAIVNLAVNARDAMPRGGKLTIATQEVNLQEVNLETLTAAGPNVQAGAYVLLSVTDTGHGMDDTIRSHLFEPFFTTKEVGKGTGLGLAMVYGFVKQSGGHVSVSSQLGMGARFQLYLPKIAQADAIEAESSGKAEVRVFARQLEKQEHETILLVEDETTVRKLVESVLQEHGYVVLAADGGAKAIEVAEAHSAAIHLLVTDVVMPQMTGVQVCEALRATHPEVKVLFLSGYTDDAVLRYGVIEAHAAFLQKPFSPVRLLTKVREVLDNSRA